jgi:beta-glucosidase
VVKAAANVDAIILCIGETTYTETPGNINNLMINQAQLDFSYALFKAVTNKPVIVVYLGGRPRVITPIADQAQAVLVSFLPGNRGGEAIADILFGDFNPSARMPITYPSTVNGVTTYDYKPAEIKLGNTYDYLYTFGHGLSYTTFEYSNLQLSTTTVKRPDSFNVSVDVTNTGALAGQEVVLLYLTDVYGCVSRPDRQLKGFRKITLQPKEKQTVEFVVTHYDLTFIDSNNKRISEKGDFRLSVGGQNATFTLTL